MIRDAIVRNKTYSTVVKTDTRFDSDNFFIAPVFYDHFKNLGDRLHSSKRFNKYFIKICLEKFKNDIKNRFLNF